MALAKYFSKNLLAISQALKGGSSGQFQDVLNNAVIGIAFDSEVKKHEGRAALDLTVRLISRLYPAIKFINLGSEEVGLVPDLKNLAYSINSEIDFSKEDPTIIITIGSTLVPRTITSGPIYYIGSDSWLVKFSNESPVGSGNTTNPLGGGVASCIGCSNIFRYVFADFLSEMEFDETFTLSLLTLDVDETNAEIQSKQVDIGKIQLVGLGAIGNGFLWALGNSPFLKGTVVVVEPEKLEESNLQRYVLAEQRHIDMPKTAIAKEFLSSSAITPILISNDWASYINVEGSWQNEFVLVAIDNLKDRIGIQASLPKQLINAYTENNLIGISRHYLFSKEACLVCTYMPTEQKKSFAFEVCENLGILNLNIPELEKVVASYLYGNKEADDQLLRWIAAGNSIELSELEKFKGLTVSDFYSKVVCGGILMELKNEGDKITTVEAPLAFQSAMAGILEFSEVVIQKARLRKEALPNKTQFYPLQPVRSNVNPYNHSFPKDNTGRCICRDQDFVNAYKSKWP